MLLKKIDQFVDNLLGSFNYLAQFLLRLGLGLAFIFHGYAKLPLPPQKLIDFFNFTPFLASLVCISELGAGILLIISGFVNSYVGNILTRISSLTIVIIMSFAFYFAHQDWFINSKLFTSEQIFLFLIGFYFLIVGNKKI
tara:strand:- start:814 stop:1233 length:420 start_codon:yes stop_codon:yes gene_type:complete